MPEWNPRISAILTAYNEAAHLREAIISVLNQTRPLDEILVVDDGSVDATPDIALSFEKDGVQLLRQLNQGPGAARNNGLSRTTGDLIAFLDGDDAWLPDKTQNQLDLFLSQPSLDLVSGDKIWWQMDDPSKRYIMSYGRPAMPQLRREIVFSNCVGNPSMVMVRRSIFDRVGPWDPDIRWCEDWELWMRIAAEGQIGFVEKPVTLYRWHDRNMSHQNIWARHRTLHGLSAREIGRRVPLWRRPFAYLRAFSRAEFARAQTTIDYDRKRHLRNAATALVTYPFDEFGGKAKELARAVVGIEQSAAIAKRLRQPGRAANGLKGDVADWIDGHRPQSG